jgi:hypothetical protein
MNTSPEFQPYVAPQPQASQLSHTQIAIAKPEQSVGTTQPVITPPLGQLDTVALVQYGGIAVAIILSIAVLILALSEYNKGFFAYNAAKARRKN